MRIFGLPQAGVFSYRRYRTVAPQPLPERTRCILRGRGALTGEDWVNEVAPAPDQAAPVVVAGVAPVARLVTAALLRTGHHVVGLVDPLDDAEPEPGELAADLDAGRTDGRYLLTDAMATGPAMFDTARLERAVSTHDNNPHPREQRQPPTPATPLRTASLDEVLCTSGPQL